MDEYTSPEFGKSALLTIDLQRDFAIGQYAIPGTTDVVPQVERLAELDAELLLAGKLQQLGENEHVFYKPRWSAFYQTDLLAHLQDVSTVVVAGCNYPNCPRSTLIDATERDLRTVAVRDALSRWTAGAADELAALGVAVCSTQEVVDALR